MKRLLTCSITIALLLALGGAAEAQQQPRQRRTARASDLASDTECQCPETPPPALSQENTLEGCRDGVDNDADGHVDCADQDCEIYAACVERRFVPPPPPPPPPAPIVSYTTMRQLKTDLHAGRISPAQFHQAWGALRQARAVELEQLKALYRSGAITRYQYKEARREIIHRYEG